MLKRALLPLLGLALGSGLSGSNPGPAATVVREVVLSPADLQIAEVDGGHRIALAGGASALPAGVPDLPALPVLAVLPENTSVLRARLEILESVELPGPFRPTLVPTSGEAGVRLADGTEPRPGDPVLRIRTGRMRGIPLGSALVSPVRWDPGTGRLVLATRMRVRFDLASAPEDPLAFRPARESREGMRSFGETLARLTGEAPSALRRTFDPATLPEGPFAPGFRPTVDGSPVDMVIVTTPDQEAEYQRLADFRTRTGTSTVVRTLDWIEANYPRGADRAETLRNFIRDAAARWGTAWVLLGGDTGRIPTRISASEGFAYEEVTTDLYFSDLDGNWNADGDAYYGEGETFQTTRDLVDLYPDVWVGRLPSNDASEAAVLVNKTLDYSRNPPLGYQRDVLLPAEVLFPAEWTPGQTAHFDGALLAEAVYDSLPPGHRAVRLYENHTAWPGSLPEEKSTVLDSLNAGFHLVHFVAHGFINTISVGLGFETLSNGDAASLANGAEQFLLVTMDCTSSAIEYNCIAESFLKNPGGGAVASIGATEVEYPTTAYPYQRELYHQIFWADSPELGRALGLSRVPFVIYAGEDNPHRWTQLSLILLGDPSLSFWTDVPAPLSVVHAATFELGDGTYAVQVAREGQPVAGARVTLTKDGDDYAVATTNAFGQAVIPFRPDLTGPFSVGAVHANSLPYLGEATVVPPTVAYLHAENQGLSDSGGAALGNGDGMLDAGETVELRFTLRNNGCAASGNVTATLSSTDPRLVILDGTSSVPSMNPGESATAVDPMVVRVDRSAGDGTEIHAALTLQAAGGPFGEDVIFFVHAPVVEYREQAVRDTAGNGNGDGIVSAGEDIVLLPSLRNAGRGALRNASVRLRSADPSVVLLDTVSVIGDLASGAVGSNPADGLRLRLNDVSTTPAMSIVVRDAYGEIFLRPIDLTAPSGVGEPASRGTSSSIELRWAAVEDSDLLGYVIQRSPDPLGPFTRVNEWTVLRTSRYEDADIPGFARLYYRIAAVDSSGNLGPWSVPVAGTASLPLHPGWPVDLGASVPGGVNLANLDGIGNPEVIGTGSEILVLTADGEDFVDGDDNVQTRGPLTNTGGTSFWNTPAAGDLDGDGTLEVVSIGWGDALVHVADRNGNTLPGWPQSANPLGFQFPNPVGSVCLADVDGDADLEVFATVGRAILGWHHDGTEIADGDADPATLGILALTGSNYSYGTPSAANIDAEPLREIVAGMRDGKLYVLEHDGTPYPGFPFAAGGDITTSPAVGDIDLDGRPEIVFGSSDGQVWAIRSDLSVAAGFPVPVPLSEDWDSSPALGDVTGDGAPDVVVASSDGRLHVLDGRNGTEPPGYPVNLAVSATSVASRSSPVVVDLDHDGFLDVIVGDRAGRLHAFDHEGKPLDGFFMQTANRIEAGPAVGDIDGDGLSEVVVQSSDQRLYVWDTPWTYDPTRAPWPMFKGNPGHTGSLADANRGTHVGVPGRPEPRFLLAVGPNPFRAATTVQYRVDGRDPAPVKLVVYDLSGREVRTLVAGTQPPGAYDVIWRGEDDASRRVGSGVYLFRLQVGAETAAGKVVLVP